MDMVDFDTYCIARKNPTSSELFLYLEEVDSCCPKCGIPFSRTKDGKFVKGYEIAHVFPNSPTPAEKIMLQNVCIAGINSEDPLNKIALCHDCHKYYDDNKSVELYNEMFDLKATKHKALEAKKLISNNNIESELTQIISKLASLSDLEINGLEKLEYKALKVSDKIEDTYILMRRRIESEVLQYFTFIRQEFANLPLGSFSFDTMATNVRHAYCTMRDQGLDKAEIYKQMTKWFERKTSCDVEACRIMVSFFVQDCEIYEELP